MAEINLGHDKLVVSTDTGDVYSDCLAMALEAVGKIDELKHYKLINYPGKNFYDYKHRPGRL